MDLMSEAPSREVLPAGPHPWVLGKRVQCLLVTITGAIYPAIYSTEPPLNGRDRTNELEEQGSSFQKVSRKTFLSVRLIDKGK